MTPMKWKEFYAIAVPEEIRKREAKKNVFIRMNRWASSREAFMAYHLSITGNAVSLFRILEAFIAIYLFSFLKEGNHLLAFLGVVLMLWNFNLDGVDGALARVQRTSSHLGHLLDNFSTDYAFFAFWVLTSAMTGSKVFLLLSLVSGYILVSLRHHLANPMPRKIDLRFRPVLYTPMILIVVPLLMIAASACGISVKTVSYVVSVGYLLVALLWFVLYVSLDPPPSPKIP